MRKALAVFALQEEVVDVKLPGYQVKTIVCGVGKARAAIGVTKAILEYQPNLVVSIGSVGTFKHHVGDIVVSTHFVDRDFAQLKLPGISYEIKSALPADLQLPSIIQGKMEWETNYIVSTGDDFVTAGQAHNVDVVDMEAYAECLACQEMGVPFFALKYITDVIGYNSVAIWADKLSDARKSLQVYFERLLLLSTKS